MGFFYFFGDGVGMSVNWGVSGVSRSGEVNPSAAGSGTDFDGVVGSIRCISISNSMHFLELMVEKIDVS